MSLTVSLFVLALSLFSFSVTVVAHRDKLQELAKPLATILDKKSCSLFILDLPAEVTRVFFYFLSFLMQNVSFLRNLTWQGITKEMEALGQLPPSPVYLYQQDKRLKAPTIAKQSQCIIGITSAELVSF